MADYIVDRSLDCCSIMKKMKIGEYLDLVQKAYDNRGGIQGQREPLKQKTAITIRNRMINDIKGGTILPPVVIGVITDEAQYSDLCKTGEIENYIQKYNDLKLSIIDGMQRTTAIIEAIAENPDVAMDEIRVEFWISYKVNSMLYRMLVLNTGQVPWNMRRQVELIFDSVVDKIEKSVDGIEVLRVDDNQRRSKSGQYNAKDLIEMFMAFGARTWKIDTKERITDEFSKGDLVQSTEEADMVDLFCVALRCMFELDCLLDKHVKGERSGENDRYKKGKDVFASAPAKIGYAAACGQLILGRPGEKRNQDEIQNSTKRLIGTFQNLTNRINKSNAVEEMIDLQTLSEVIGTKSSRIGDFEREKFYSAFKVLLEREGKLDSLTVCWRA